MFRTKHETTDTSRHVKVGLLSPLYDLLLVGADAEWADFCRICYARPIRANYVSVFDVVKAEECE